MGASACQSTSRHCPVTVKRSSGSKLPVPQGPGVKINQVNQVNQDVPICQRETRTPLTQVNQVNQVVPGDGKHRNTCRWPTSGKENPFLIFD
jgi:hypothetical protein